MNTTDTDAPSYVRPEAAALEPDLTLIHDLLGGTRRMWEQSHTYIRKWTNEEPAVYEIRRKCETLFEGFARTLSAVTGMLFAKPPAVTWGAGEVVLKPHLDNIDAAGNNFSVFAKRFAEASLRDGLGAILVDHPAPPTDAEGNPVVVTAAVEAEYNLRPIWARYGRRAVINWDVGSVNNAAAPVMVMLQESAEVPHGRYGKKVVPRFRELRLVLTPAGFQAVWMLHEEREDSVTKQKGYELVGQGVFRNRNGAVASFLPIALAYTGRSDGIMHAGIPLMGVAWANLAHWQIATNLRFNRDVGGFDQLVVTGQLAQEANGQPGALKVGPLVGIHLEQGGTAEWKSPLGAGSAQLEKGKTEKLMEMAQQGVSFMQTDTRAAETAEAKRLDATAENATLATAAQGIEDALNLALEYHAWYLGIEKAQAPTCQISRDYESTGMPAPLLTAWVGAIANAGLPVRLLLNVMRQAGLISADEDLDALEMEISANQAAIAADKAEAEAERAAQMPMIGGAPEVPPVGQPEMQEAA